MRICDGGLSVAVDMATRTHLTTTFSTVVLVLLTFASIPATSDEFNAAEGQIVCYECFNIVEGVYQPHCPKNGSVGPWTWKINCTGSCYTRTDDQNPDLIYRGCTDNQPFLPDPLPKVGCYPYYLEVWCICGHSGCNGGPMGKPGKVELDAHLPKEIDKDEIDGAYSVIGVDVWRIKLAVCGLLTVYIVLQGTM
ncbi:uncharacterized protein [Haliotis cracherodii]|uniref:uncharacterized protein n=1 Tax=Haliotis cracherodii TaxID=6455 RepID=UPI0039EB0708